MLSIVKKGLVSSICAFCITLLTACHDDDQAIKVGTIAGPETEVAEVAAAVAAKDYGLNIKIVTFTDYIHPNAALNDGELQANVFQHTPYLNEQITSHHYDLAIVGKTFIYPMGIYSSHYHALAEVPNDAQIAIPNDPTNEGRALLLLQQAGLITLSPNAGLQATLHNITDNPKHFSFVELDAAQLPRAFRDVALAVINTNYAIPAGLLPSKDALFMENNDSPYANLIVVRQADVNQPWVKGLVDAFHSQEVVDKANELFQEQVVPAFTPIETTSTNGRTHSE